MPHNHSLFLRQSQTDAWNDYLSASSRANVPGWDAVILTASDDRQAQNYRAQIQRRLDGGHLPRDVHYAVLPDPDGKRIGSGGATLCALRYIFEQKREDSFPFQGKRILLIHSGGDSKRIPQYSACGKLFSPVPRILPDGRRSTLFDELVIATAGVPARMKDGMLLMSGDVLMAFNPLQIDFGFGGVAGISIQEDAEIGKNHGVYLQGDGHAVRAFLHKQPVNTLRQMGAVNDRGRVDVDTGAVLMDSEFLADLFSTVCRNDVVDADLWDAFVNEDVRLNFYGDFLYPLAEGSTLEQYLLESGELPIGDKLTACRRALWEALRPHRMRVLSLSPAMFLHFGTTRELRDLYTRRIEELRFLDWTPRLLCRETSGACACSNAWVGDGARIGKDAYLEDCRIDGAASIGEGCVISNTSLRDVAVPAATVVHGLSLRNGGFVARVYGVHDNPKNGLDGGMLLGRPLRDFAEMLGKEALWGNLPHDLWNARLYPVCDTMEDAVVASLALFSIQGFDKPSIAAWRDAPRLSLRESFELADGAAAMTAQDVLTEDIVMQNVIDALRDELPARELQPIFGAKGITSERVARLEKVSTTLPLWHRMRVLHGLGTLLSHENTIYGNHLRTSAFDMLQNKVVSSINSVLKDKPLSYHQDAVRIALPLRVNWGGGWSDTPPYCYENGGTVLNAAVRIRDQNPAVAVAHRLDKSVVILESIDSGAKEVFRDLAPLQDHSNPFDPFALHKAALLACGILPMDRNISLPDVLDALGGGIYLSTEMLGIPRGSGLGTSSILAGACVQALQQIFGMQESLQGQYDRVLCIEQIMGTGGGWQDQVGGMTPGIKYTETRPGLRQSFSVQDLLLPESAIQELSDRFALIYTGQRRLARNLLREVMGRYIDRVPEAVAALHRIQRIAVLMKFELEHSNIDAFATLLSEQWACTKQLDPNCSNTCIEQIFASCEHLLSGRMICGAGGGGFLQVILKKGTTKETLRHTLLDVFGDSGVGVWDCSFT